jgi:Cd2+/Zn2+-exporting ATPase
VTNPWNIYWRDKVKKYRLHNLDCVECGVRIEEGLKRLDSVRSAQVNFATATLELDTDNVDAAMHRMKKIVPDVKLSEITQTASEPQINPWRQNQKELFVIGLSTLLIVIGMILGDRLEATPYAIGKYGIFLTAYFLSGWRVLWRAVRNGFRGRFFDENFLMSAATIGAIIIGQLTEAAGVMLFFQIGEFLQDLSLERSRYSIQKLLKVRPQFAVKVVDGREVRVDPESVKVGDAILVKPGEKIPIDGVITAGRSQVDTSPLTGESVPRVLHENDTALAGMINRTGVLTLRVIRPFEESSISKILYLVEQAVDKKSKTERFITRFARFYTPVVLALALGIALLPPILIPGAEFGTWVYRALVILVVSCPCALLVSVPLGFFAGIGKASRQGILVKGANFLEVLANLRSVVFDKTGTLTKGVFRVTEVVPTDEFSSEEVLRFAADGESHSQHPIAQSIKEAYHQTQSHHDHHQPPGDPSDEYEEIGGYGVRATIGNRTILVGNDRLLHRERISHDACHSDGTVVHVVVDGTYAGYIIISDGLKDEAESGVRELRELGVERVGMLTGDNNEASRAIAAKLGLDFYHADLLPEEKVTKLEEILEGGRTAFVGDGINDAPVIARADVGVAMGKLGSEAAIETADVVLMSHSPGKLAESIRIARKTKKVVWQNIIFALAVKGLFVALGSLGMAAMWEAVFADMGVALIAIFNAMRIFTRMPRQ